MLIVEHKRRILGEQRGEKSAAFGVLAVCHHVEQGMAFGVGEHFCIGTHLARLETRVMFEGILERMHDMELAGPVSYLRSNLIDGVKHIPLKFSGVRS